MNDSNWGDGADVDVITKDIQRLIVNDQAQLLNQALHYYPVLVDRRDINERCWLHTAADSGSWGCLEVLLGHGLDVNTTDVMGETPLHRSVARQRQQATQWLLSNGANPNAINAHGATPTLYAAGWSNEVLNMLVEHGGDAQVVDRSGDGVEQWAARGARLAIQAAQVKQLSKPKGSGTP